jgi:hypothetical protein
MDMSPAHQLLALRIVQDFVSDVMHNVQQDVAAAVCALHLADIERVRTARLWRVVCRWYARLHSPEFQIQWGTSPHGVDRVPVEVCNEMWAEMVMFVPVGDAAAQRLLCGIMGSGQGPSWSTFMCALAALRNHAEQDVSEALCRSTTASDTLSLAQSSLREAHKDAWRVAILIRHLERATVAGRP